MEKKWRKNGEKMKKKWKKRITIQINTDFVQIKKLALQISKLEYYKIWIYIYIYLFIFYLFTFSK